MIPSYVDRIIEWSLPLTGKDLKSFLGFTGYCRSFIKEYLFLTAEMNKMKQDDTPNWDENTKLKLEKLKKCFPLEDTPDTLILNHSYWTWIILQPT